MARFEIPARLLLVSLACALLTSAPVHPMVRAIGALPLVLYLPGRCVMAAIFARARGDGETRALAAALSLALVTLLGLGLDRFHALSPAAWVRALSVVCTVACLAAVVTSVASKTPFQERGPRVPFGSWHLVALALAIGMAGFSYQLASRGALSHRPDLFTDLWMVPAGAPISSSATVGIRNEEGHDAAYTLDVVARGALIERIPSFPLRDREEKTFQVAIPVVVYEDAASEDKPEPPAMNAQQSRAAALRARQRDAALLRVEVRLFKDGSQEIYRRAWVALPAARAGAPMVAETEEGLPSGDLSAPGAAMTMRTAVTPNRAALIPAATAPGTAGPLPSSVDDTRAAALPVAEGLSVPGAATITRDLQAGSADAGQSLRAPAFATRTSRSGTAASPLD